MVDLGEAMEGVCGAWIQVPTVASVRRTCVLAPGHYVGPAAGTQPGMHAARNDESWHTDCPDVAGLPRPRDAAGLDHNHERACLVWADSADGAHPSRYDPVTETQPVTPDAVAEEVIKDSVNQSGRTLGTDIIGGYRADVKVGDASMSVYGPAKFVAYMIREFAMAFEEEAER